MRAKYNFHSLNKYFQLPLQTFSFMSIFVLKKNINLTFPYIGLQMKIIVKYTQILNRAIGSLHKKRSVLLNYHFDKNFDLYV